MGWKSLKFTKLNIHAKIVWKLMNYLSKIQANKKWECTFRNCFNPLWRELSQKHTQKEKNLNLYKLNEWLMINNSTVKSEINGFSPSFSNSKNVTESWDSRSTNVQNIFFEKFSGIPLLSYDSSSLPPLFDKCYLYKLVQLW